MKKKLVFILTVVFLSVSCSRLDIAVNLANSYIVHKTDDYFDLTKEQSKRLKESLAKDINQVKKTIFPQLAAEMLKIADTVSFQKTFDSTFVSATYQRIENLFMEGVRIFTPTAVALAGDLSPNQITLFQKEVDEKLNDLKKDSEKKSFDKMKKQFDSWFGSMTSNQKDDLKKFVEKNPGPTKLSVYNRQTLAHNFVRAFPDKNARKKYVEKILWFSMLRTQNLN